MDKKLIYLFGMTLYLLIIINHISAENIDNCSEYEEICDNIDNNCDGFIDNNIPDAIDGIDVGECKPEIRRCIFGEWVVFQERQETDEEICDELDNDCDYEIDEDNVCTSFNLFSPENKIYNTNNIMLNLTLDLQENISDKISYIDISDKRPREITLCRNCREYGYFINKLVKFKDGNHSVLFNAYNRESNLSKTSEFFIDTKKPQVKLPRVRAKGFTNGTFIIEYSEENLKEVILYYEDRVLVKQDCASGKNQKCELFVDLNEYSNEEIDYSFMIVDIAGNYIQTKNMTAIVDLVSPAIEEISYPVIGNFIYFKFKINEENFQELSYLDNSLDNPKWKILCSVLKNGICEKEQRFKPGDHYLTVRVIDKAGNSVFSEV